MKKQFIQIFSVIFLSAMATFSAKADTVGTLQFYDGVKPEILSPGLAQKTKVICYKTFCSNNSGFLREPVYSAEYLTLEGVEAAKGVSRASMNFFPDPNIPSDESGQLSDYSRSGYDRGHMAPWADSADPQCFTLANILPQNPDNNRKLWEGIETATRHMVASSGELYVVSGGIFTGKNINMLNGRVAIPDMLYKAIYDPVSHNAGVYIVRNEPGFAWTEISLKQLEGLSHVRPFPTLNEDEMNMKGLLPLPDVHGKKIPMSNSINTAPIGSSNSQLLTNGPTHIIGDFLKRL